MKTVHNTLPLVLFAGPCVIENKKTTMEIAHYLSKLSRRLNIKVVFKASFDKANRTSVHSFRGVGISAGLRILQQVKDTYKIPVVSDVHTCSDVEQAALVCDVIQIPAFLCRQTDLLVAAGRSGKTINIKKGQFMAPEDMIHAVRKITSTGNNNVMLTERGYSFGYHNLVVDMRSLEIMKEFGYPVIFDATHSVQLPGGMGSSSGGQQQFIEPLARAAIAVGIAGIFVETHPRPERARSDGSNSVPMRRLDALVKKLMQIDRVIKKN